MIPSTNRRWRSPLEHRAVHCPRGVEERPQRRRPTVHLDQGRRDRLAVRERGVHVAQVRVDAVARARVRGPGRRPRWRSSIVASSTWAAKPTAAAASTDHAEVPRALRLAGRREQAVHHVARTDGSLNRRATRGPHGGRRGGCGQKHVSREERGGLGRGPRRRRGQLRGPCGRRTRASARAGAAGGGRAARAGRAAARARGNTPSRTQTRLQPVAEREELRRRHRGEHVVNGSETASAACARASRWRAAERLVETRGPVGVEGQRPHVHDPAQHRELGELAHAVAPVPRGHALDGGRQRRRTPRVERLGLNAPLAQLDAQQGRARGLAPRRRDPPPPTRPRAARREPDLEGLMRADEQRLLVAPRAAPVGHGAPGACADTSGQRSAGRARRARGEPERLDQGPVVDVLRCQSSSRPEGGGAALMTGRTPFRPARAPAARSRAR